MNPSDTRILVLDDDDSYTVPVSAGLIREGFSVESCNDAANVMALVEKFKPTIILVDAVWFEKGNRKLYQEAQGPDLIREFEQLECVKNGETKIAMVSNKITEAELQEMGHEWHNGIPYLLKPRSIRYLIDNMIRLGYIEARDYICQRLPLI